MDNYHTSDFTELHYRELLRQVKKQWPIRTYPEFKQEGRAALWRHDIDMSMVRARRIAEIEHEEGVQATFFVHLHNEFYHFWERETLGHLKVIQEMGHPIGLHFEPCFYDLKRGEEERLELCCEREKRLLEEVLDAPVEAISFHNPDIGCWHLYEEERIAGMINTYNATFKLDWDYCSDSNGYWRFQRLADFLTRTENEKIHVLTHPGWWQEEAMLPRERVSRCVEERASATLSYYDRLLAGHGRVNVGQAQPSAR